MTELEIQRKLQTLRESFDRIKALLAWERLKRAEANASRPWTFPMSDATPEELKDEYSFFLALLLNTYAALDGSPMPEVLRQNLQRQLADLDWQVHVLHLERRF